MTHDQAYFEAEKKIEEALKSGATELDLRRMELTELPDSLAALGALTQLQSLKLSDNQLTALPESLWIPHKTGWDFIASPPTWAITAGCANLTMMPGSPIFLM